MFEAGAVTYKKEHVTCEKNKGCHDIHGMYSKLLSVVDKDMWSDLCKSLDACTAPVPVIA